MAKIAVLMVAESLAKNWCMAALAKSRNLLGSDQSRFLVAYLVVYVFSGHLWLCYALVARGCFPMSLFYY